MINTPLTATALEEQLEGLLDAVLSSRRTAATPALALARCTRAEQAFALHWAQVIGRDNAELAYQFAAAAAEAIRLMDLESCEAWLLQAMDLSDKKGQMPAIHALQQVAGFAASQQEKRAGALLSEHAAMLERFVHGLAGRALKVAAGERWFTDTETLFLPAVVGHLPDKAANFRLLKAMAVHQWAQNWYGTWRGGGLLGALEAGRLSAADLPRFHALETIRLDARLARDLPGLHRDLIDLGAVLDGNPDATLHAAARPLTNPAASVADTLAVLARHPALPAARCCYQGELDPAAVRGRLDHRLALEREQFRIALARLVNEADQARRPEPLNPPDPAAAARLATRRRDDPEAPDGVTWELLLGGRPIAPPAEVQSLMASIIQDLGEVPPDYLVTAGPGPYHPTLQGQPRDPDSVWAGTDHEDGAFHYDEWDHSRQHYRKDWCVLREHALRGSDPDFYRATLARHSGAIKALRRTFEALRGEDCTLRRQTHGEDVDIDALVEAHADTRAGLELTDRLFCCQRRDQRSLAAMLMVDMSGSTKGWINQAEREALILLGEALDVLGDRFAIYGFSGWTRKRCEVYPVKGFNEPWGDPVKARIGAIEPKDYTRMGAPIRHLSKLLLAEPARTRLLMTLSDGKPDDYDPQYRGDYAIADTRSALFEARAAGIHPFCITIDEEGADYLPHLYGPANFTVVADIARLPAKVSEIYRRIAC